MVQRISDHMPVTARHQGIWRGTYRRYNTAGDLFDQHESEVSMWLRDDPSEPEYFQTNRYHHEGKDLSFIETYGAFKNGRLTFISDRIEGWGVDMSPAQDPHQRSSMLHITYKEDTGVYKARSYMYELVQISDCGMYRTRVAQFLEPNGQIMMRTQIDETKVAETS